MTTHAAPPTKSCVGFALKAADDAARTFSGLAAAWSLDLGGDVIRKGAFARTLDHWRAAQKARPIQLIDQHDYASSRSVIGKLTDAEETDAGLEATFQMVPDDPDAEAVYRRIKGGFITGLSIGYEPKQWTYETQGEGAGAPRVRVLSEVKLLEVSVVTWPMNEDARIDAASVKHVRALLRDGRFTDAERQELRALLDATPAGRHDPARTDGQAKGLAPDDPRRIAAEALLRAITIRRLATAHEGAPGTRGL
jgi:uncharacterized protein